MTELIGYRGLYPLRPRFFNWNSLHSMKRKLYSFSLVATMLFWTAQAVGGEATALDKYVAAADSSYGYDHYFTADGDGYTTHFIAMSSQQWRASAEVDRVQWKHEVLIAVPWSLHSGNKNTAILIVNGGSNLGDLTTEHNEFIGWLAVLTGSVVATVNQIPNQPLYFSDEAGQARKEDAILAYGMDKYLLTRDPEWLAQLPMTKAVVRAMDAVQDFAQSSEDVWPELPSIDGFILLGGSKRGWTAWLTAAVEAQKGSASRVKGILPASIDLLNMDEQFRHHWESYGFYAPAVRDYEGFDLPCRAKTPGSQAMLKIIDPYEYRDRLTMPKLVLNSAGDQFFLPDSSQFYYEDLPGPKWMRYSLNTDHSQSQELPNLILPALSWLSDVRDNKGSPKFSWSLKPDGSIRVQTDTEPKQVRLWQATNPSARDFRLEKIGPVWTSSKLYDIGGGLYIGYVDPPPQGWTAYTVELTFPGSTLVPTPLESDQVFTTDVQVTPADLPFQDGSCPDTPGLYNPDWPTFELATTNTSGDPDVTVSFPQAGAAWTPLSGDWDGDGRHGIGLFQSDTRSFYLKNHVSPGGPDVRVAFDWIDPSGIPLVGDWDGDGVDSLGVYYPDTRSFELRNTNTLGQPDIAVTYAQAGSGWKPVSGDWDGDGRDGIGLYQPETRTFFLKNEIVAGGADIAATYDQAPVGWTPLAGDWNGDGLDTLGLYQPATRVFYLDNDLQPRGPVKAVQFGLNATGWLPIVGLWDWMVQ